VLILADDLDLTLDTINHMPNLQELLVQQGISFTNFFVPLSLCCPSRVTILLGQYAHNHQVYTNDPPTGGYLRFQGLRLENDTVATALQIKGYQTVLIGKYLNGYGGPHVPPGWDEWYSPTYSVYYHLGFNYTLNENGELVEYGNSEEDYFTDVLKGKSLDFIQRIAPTGAPFFMYIAPAVPHSPAVPAPRHADLFPGVRAPRTRSFNEADVSDKPKRVQKFNILSDEQISRLDLSFRNRVRSMQAVDEMIAEIVGALARTNELDQTYIIFTSDNGYHMGQHRLREGKGFPYEEDLRVPFIIRGPGLPQNVTRQHLATMVDLAPTITILAGAKMDHGVDGCSLLPLFREPPINPAQWRKAFLIEFFIQPRLNLPSIVFDSFVSFKDFRHAIELFLINGINRPPPGVQDYIGFRTTMYKYVKYSLEGEFYDLSNDPFEMKNQYSNLDLKFREQLDNYLAALQECVGDACRELERTPPQVPATPGKERAP
jgi:arylsulfatase A-like enzyme